MIEPNELSAHEAAPFNLIVSVPSPPLTESYTLKPLVKSMLSFPEPPTNTTFSFVVAARATPPVLSAALIVPVVNAPEAVPAKSIAVVTVSFLSPETWNSVNVELPPAAPRALIKLALELPPPLVETNSFSIPSVVPAEP